MFCTTDIPPKGAAPMHRTLSLDYAAVISGEIVLLLDGGEEKTIRAGEYIVQRGVNHSWINRSEAVCRIMCVMVGAEKIVLEDGTELGETVFNKK
jgi:quercetin dioxygenase-like cupin family protein